MLDLYDYLVNHPDYLNSFKNTVVLGVAGTNAAGKDGLMNILEANKFLVYHTSDHLREITRSVFNSTKRGGNDAPMGIIGNAQRRRYPGGMVELGLIDWWARIGHLDKAFRPAGLAIGSIRGTGEVERLKAIGGKLVLVDADPIVRYERIKSRMRHDEIDLTYNEFIKEEEAELAHGQTDPTKFGMAAVIKAADITIYNNGSLEEFHAQIKQALHKYCAINT